MDWLQMGALLAREITSDWCIRCALAYFQPNILVLNTIALYNIFFTQFAVQIENIMFFIFKEGMLLYLKNHF